MFRLWLAYSGNISQLLLLGRVSVVGGGGFQRLLRDTVFSENVSIDKYIPLKT